MNHQHDTIVAVSSAPGRSLRSLIRLSGPNVQDILSRWIAHPGEDASGPDAPSAPLSPRPGHFPARQVTAVSLRLESTSDQAPPAACGLPQQNEANRPAPSEAENKTGGFQGGGVPRSSNNPPERQQSAPHATSPQTHGQPSTFETPAPTAAKKRGVSRGTEPPGAATTEAPPLTSHHLDLPALLTFFPGPGSYTGDDLAEIQAPGNPALLDRLVSQAVTLGARIAEPGEFTFRAYLAGKLDLTQAEGIAATIAATSDGQLHAAGLLREGQLGRLATAFVSDLANLLALVEAGIDFVDQEDVVPISPADLASGLADLRRRIADLLDHSRAWSSLEGLPRVVLAGPPSAGKSTLFNALLGRQRAVVDPLPGTTRDVLEEPLVLGESEEGAEEPCDEGARSSTTVRPETACGLAQQDQDGRPAPRAGQTVEVMLVDIAGLDTPVQALDRSVQEAARRALAGADLVLLIDDGQPRPAAPQVVNQMVPPGVPRLLVLTKSDLTPAAPEAACGLAQPEEDPRPTLSSDGNDGNNACETRNFQGDRAPAAPAIPVSALTGRGLHDLRRAIRRRLGDRAVSVAGEMLALQPRHERALRSAAAHLAESEELVQPQREQHQLDHVELIAAGLRLALDELAGLGGQMTPDDVIGRIFATFCVGK